MRFRLALNLPFSPRNKKYIRQSLHDIFFSSSLPLYLSKYERPPILQIILIIDVYVLVLFTVTCLIFVFVYFEFILPGKPLQAHEGQIVPGGSYLIRRRDVAKFMVDAAENGNWKRACVAIAT